MMAASGVEIRDAAPADQEALVALYRAAFPEEELIGLVRSLGDEPARVTSLLAMAEGGIAGHVMLTNGSVEGRPVALLGPLAVAPEWQRQGIGRALIEAGLKRMREAGVVRVCVLGDPAFYGRFGFAVERAVAAPYQLPQEWHGAWQSVALGEATVGQLQLPEPWMQEHYWRP